MALTNETAQAVFVRAARELQKIAASPESSDAEVRLAEQRHRELQARFLGKVDADIQARTAKFAAFIASMEEVLASMKDGALARIQGLRAVVSDARKLVETAAGEEEE